MRFYADLMEEVEALPGSEAMLKMLGMNKQYAERHRDVVKEWGRFPHRNAILGRESTPEEVKGMEEGKIASF